MKLDTKPIIAAVALLTATATLAQMDPSQQTPIPPGQLPRSGTYWLASGLGGLSAPLPCAPANTNTPVYLLPNGQYLALDTSDSDATLALQQAINAVQAFAWSASPGLSDLESGPDSPSEDPGFDATRNYAKFMNQTFSVIDTNATLVNGDTNLYAVCISFPDDTNPGPWLQIARHGPDAVIMKANHFDYSAENRDFALIVSDRAERPVWKNVDLSGSSDAQDGWLIQGAVPAYKVTDPLFLIVSNINPAYCAFFRAIPYGGPQVLLTGAQDYDTVSNTITLTVEITDLSGTTTTNQQQTVRANGLATRSALGPNNTISLDTQYAPNGYEEIEFTMGTIPVTFDPENAPLHSQMQWDTTATLPLNFENPAFLVNASDMCSPDVGTNYIAFGVNQADHISATISEPSSGRLLASFSMDVPYATTVYLPWNFTEADGVTPYTNDTYRVHFVADDPTTLDVTNNIDKQGVRMGGGTIMTYAQEDVASDQTGAAAWCNARGETWICQALTFLYNDIYDPWGLTQYYTWEVGIGRNLTTFFLCTPAPFNGWRAFIREKLGSALYSDATLGPLHGGRTSFAGRGAGNTVSGRDVANWTRTAGTNWRMRKVALWSCFSAANDRPVNPTAFPPFSDAFGIRSKQSQITTFMRKNVGLFWAKDLTEDIRRGWSVAEAAEAVDEAWVCGPNAWPGACDPTWGFSRMVRAVVGVYPELKDCAPAVAGYEWLPYSSMYDDELMRNDASHINP